MIWIVDGGFLLRLLRGTIEWSQRGVRVPVTSVDYRTPRNVTGTFARDRHLITIIPKGYSERNSHESREKAFLNEAARNLRRSEQYDQQFRPACARRGSLRHIKSMVVIHTAVHLCLCVVHLFVIVTSLTTMNSDLERF